MDYNQTRRVNNILLPVIDNYSNYKKDIKRNNNSLLNSYNNSNNYNSHNDVYSKNNNIMINPKVFSSQKVFKYYCSKSKLYLY